MLDLGCGTGLLTRLALMHGAAKVVGVDTNHTMCSLATRALKAANIPPEKYEIFHGTVEEYAADKDIKFDVMVSKFWVPYIRVKIYLSMPNKPLNI